MKPDQLPMGSNCKYCGEWIPIGVLSAVKHFEKSEKCMVYTISDGLKSQDTPMIIMGKKMKEDFDKFVEIEIMKKALH